MNKHVLRTVLGFGARMSHPTMLARQHRLSSVRRGYRLPLATLVACLVSPSGVLAGGVVGNGTLSSCTEAALDAALPGGGSVTFDCGAAPVTITLTSEKAILTDTVIDGGGLVTLSGANTVRVLMVSAAATLTIRALTITDGFAEKGAAVLNDGGTLIVSDCTFSGNLAFAPEQEPPPEVRGGAIYGPATIADSTFVNNAAWSDNAVGISTGGAVYGAGTITNSTFSGNWVREGEGGAVYFYDEGTISNSTFSENEATSAGGAVYFNAGGAVRDSTFSMNLLYTGEAAGAIYANEHVDIQGSTFAYNTARMFGGAIYGIASVTNSTFVGNHAWQEGGAFYGEGVITNSTFFGNTDDHLWGTIRAAGTVTLTNSIVRGWGFGMCGNLPIIDGGHNLQFPISDCGPTIPTVDPLLDVLADNGGPTHTVALLPGSPAIDGGNDAVCAAPPIDGLDQRGEVRPGAGHAHCSIGAYEFSFPTMTPTPTPIEGPTEPIEPPTPSPSTTATGTATPTDTATGTPTATQSPTPLCAATPVAGCRQSGKGSIRLKDSLINSRDTMAWKWGRGAATHRVEFGNPLTGSTRYAICVYDETAGAQNLVLSALVPEGRTCAGKPCWRETARGFRYLDPNMTPDGVQRMVLTAGGDGRASITVKAKGDRFPMPMPASPSQMFRQDSRVTVQLVNSDGGVCWEAVFSAPARRNKADQFMDSLP
jgi:predicted outer membrane repeat protein